MNEQDHEQGDAAAEAFEAMRGELALLRRAVEGLAAERGAVDAPDYTETLGRIQQGTDAAAERIAAINDVIARSPALTMTPAQFGGQIVAAGNVARREDQGTIATARKGLEDATRQLQGYVVSGRTGDEQNRWLAGSAIGGLIVGMALWAAFAGPIARVVPEGWLWPERMAARTLDRPMWNAGQRMMNIAAPESWRAIVDGDKIVAANRDAIDRCRKAASKTRESVRCTVRIEPEQRR